MLKIYAREKNGLSSHQFPVRVCRFHVDCVGGEERVPILSGSSLFLVTLLV